MGGVCIVIAMLAGTAVCIPFSKETIPMMIVVLLFSLIGFLDDFLKIKTAERGLKSMAEVSSADPIHRGSDGILFH